MDPIQSGHITSTDNPINKDTRDRICEEKKSSEVNLQAKSKKQIKTEEKGNHEVKKVIREITSKGIYVEAVLSGVNAMCCIDTGACNTIISSKLYNSIPETKRPVLEAFQNYRSADGSVIKTSGVGLFNLHLGEAEIEKHVTVADITEDILLGADILQEPPVGPVVLDFVKEKMILPGLSIPLILVDSQHKLRKVAAADYCTIPPLSEMLIDVYVDRCGNEKNDSSVIIEPAPNLDREWNLIMATCLVNVADNTTVKVRLLNPMKNEVTIPPNTVLGFAQQYQNDVVPMFDTEGNNTGNLSNVRRITLDNTPMHRGRKRYIRNLGDEKKKRNPVKIPPHLQELYEASEKQGVSEREELAKILLEFQDVFSTDSTDLGRTHLGKHSIETSNARPVRLPPRRVPLAFEGEDRKAIEQLVKQGSIRPSTSPWASPIVMVRKRDGSVRPCIDYRRLNTVTVPDTFPLPRTEDCLDAMSGSVLFSTLDITSAYNQIPVNEDDIPKTAFITKFGLYEYTTMPFGLCNAPSTFQRIIELALQGLQWTSCLIYLDDVIIFGRCLEEHMSRLRAVLRRIRKANLKLKPSKCHLLQKEVEFLGHVVSEAGILPPGSHVWYQINPCLFSCIMR